MLRRIFTTATLLLVLSWFGAAQEISGIVQDMDTKEAIPFANIWIKGTMQGTQSNAEGRFILKKTRGDTLAISTVGYQQMEIVLNGKNEQFTVELKKVVQKIEEVTVKSDIPFAKVVFNLIQKHKEDNLDKLHQVRDYKQLENTTVYIAVDTTAKINRFFDNMEEVTMEMEGQNLCFSPIYLLEEAEFVSPDSMNVVYKKKDGIFPRLNPAIESLVLNNVVVDLDFYKEQIRILDRGFISPIASSAWMYYNIFFNDSVYEG
ncbi:MAG TPA: carboxypeptidase-like regulatory domain-containing protein, partial [Draconibacterium sp.]|nr:carboxypeptidase-like regulatory domain-containing protein [Draconibacterium sp.]